MIIEKNEIENFEKIYRASFVNSLAGFRQAVLVGTKSSKGEPNLAIFNSLIHLGASPALFGLISRPDSVSRHTLENILETNEYTLNYMHSKDYEKSHQTSARYDREINEFEAVGHTEYYTSGFNAPFVSEAVVKIAMKLEDKISIPLNGTILLVGSIVHLELDSNLVGLDGYVDLSAAEVLISQGLDAYFTVNPIGRLPYAKPYLL
jgi:flavin reductase (DIM6/NTAB) family NADH-FMN oxidoreductase RutF